MSELLVTHALIVYVATNVSQLRNKLVNFKIFGGKILEHLDFLRGWFSVLAEVVLPACPCMEEPRPVGFVWFAEKLP
jgi:hypothetical protein